MGRKIHQRTNESEKWRMTLKSILSPDTSVLLGVAEGAIIAGIYSGYLPSFASIRTADPHDGDIESARKAAAWTAGALLAFMFILTRDRNAFLIGGLVLTGVDFTVKHGNGINPSTGKLDSNSMESLDEGELTNVYPMAQYDNEEDVI